MTEENLEGLAPVEAAPQSVESSSSVGEKLKISYETRTKDILEALEVYDRKNRIDTHRNLQIMGIFFVLWMFVPNVFDDPTQIMSWIMILLAGTLMVFVLKFPAYTNNKFAKSRAENSPEYRLEITRDGIDVHEGGGHFYIAFAEGCNIYNFKGVYACCFDKNRVFAIPKDQLSEDELERMYELFRDGLGERFEKVPDDPRAYRGGFGFGRKK